LSPSPPLAQLKFGTATNARVINTGHALQVEWDDEIGLDAKVPIVGEWPTTTLK
jgi:hypothetical protein